MWGGITACARRRKQRWAGDCRSTRRTPNGRCCRSRASAGERITQAAYPNGIDQPSITGCDIAVFQGWPKFEALSAALDAGHVQISVFPRPDERVTTVTADDGGWDEQSHEDKTGIG